MLQTASSAGPAKEQQTQDAVAAAAGAHETTINEVQLLLAEQRTGLSVMRTGIAMVASPCHCRSSAC